MRLIILIIALALVGCASSKYDCASKNFVGYGGKQAWKKGR